LALEASEKLTSFQSNANFGSWERTALFVPCFDEMNQTQTWAKFSMNNLENIDCILKKRFVFLEKYLDIFKKVKKSDFFYLSKFLIIILNFVFNYTKKTFLYNFVTNHKNFRPTHYYFVHSHRFSIYNSFSWSNKTK